MSAPKTIVKSVRMTEELIKKINDIREIESKSFQDIISESITDYVDKKEKTNIELSDAIDNNDYLFQEYLYVPANYYALFNDLSSYEVQKLIKTEQVKSVVIGKVQLIVVDINDSMYKKSELIVIKNNVNTVMKEMHKLKNEVHKLRREKNKEKN